MKKKVSIIGMGMVASGWSIAFARAGCTVVGWDPFPEAGNASLKVVDQLIAELEKRNLLKVGSARDITERIHPADSLGTGLGPGKRTRRSGDEAGPLENSRSAGGAFRYLGQLELRDRAHRVQFRSAASPPLSGRTPIKSAISDPCG
jgi:hypothetical protein